MICNFVIQDKLKLRLKILEDGLKQAPSVAMNPHIQCGSPKPEKTNHFFGILSSNAGLKRRSTSQPRASSIRTSEKLSSDKTTSNSLLRKSLWATRNKVVDNIEKENTNSVNSCNNGSTEAQDMVAAKATCNNGDDDMVSGYLYDRLQKEVISLRKSCEAKDSYMNSKDEEIKVPISYDLLFFFFHVFFYKFKVSKFLFLIFFRCL